VRRSGCLGQAEIACHGRLAADLHEILEDRRAADADLRHDHAVPIKPDIVADLGPASPFPDRALRRRARNLGFGVGAIVAVAICHAGLLHGTIVAHEINRPIAAVASLYCGQQFPNADDRRMRIAKLAAR